MTYVDVVLDRPAATPFFTYALKPDQLPVIREGSLVEVPLGPRTEYGVVWQLRRRLPTRLAGKIRSLSRVLSPGSWAPAQTRRLALKLSRATGQSLGVCLFRLMLPAGKQRLPLIPDSRSVPGQLIHALGPRRERWIQYQALIKKAATAHRSTICIAPAPFHTALRNALAPEISTFVVTGQLAASRQREQVAQFLANPGSLLLGTRHVIGWPALNLGLLIVDDVTHQSHEDEQRPYAAASLIATLRQQVEGGHVILGSGVPSLQMARDELESRAALLPQVPWQERVTFSSAHSLAELSARDEDAVIIAPRHGKGGTLRCRDCGQIHRCESCGGELNVLGSALQCYDCRAEVPLPAACQHCGGHQLSTQGVGVEAIRAELCDSRSVVGTEQLIDTLGKVEVIYFAYADSPLLSPDLTRTIRYLSRIVEAAGLARRVIVQTHHPEHPLWRYLLARSAADRLPFLTERKERRLAPYASVL